MEIFSLVRLKDFQLDEKVGDEQEPYDLAGGKEFERRPELPNYRWVSIYQCQAAEDV